jgi:hemerythrin
VAQVKQLQQELGAGKATVSQEVMSFLQSWLISHILRMDKKYTSHLQAPA